jgi:hypothetical protein
MAKPYFIINVRWLRFEIRKWCLVIKRGTFSHSIAVISETIQRVVDSTQFSPGRGDHLDLKKGTKYYSITIEEG